MFTSSRGLVRDRSRHGHPDRARRRPRWAVTKARRYTEGAGRELSRRGAPTAALPRQPAEQRHQPTCHPHCVPRCLIAGVASSRRYLNGCHGLAGFSSGDGEDASLVRPRLAPGALCGVQARRLGSPHRLLPKHRIPDRRRPYRGEKLQAHLVGNEFVVWKGSSARVVGVGHAPHRAGSVTAPSSIPTQSRLNLTRRRRTSCAPRRDQPQRTSRC